MGQSPSGCQLHATSRRYRSSLMGYHHATYGELVLSHQMDDAVLQCIQMISPKMSYKEKQPIPIRAIGRRIEHPGRTGSNGDHGAQSQSQGRNESDYYSADISPSRPPTSFLLNDKWDSPEHVSAPITIPVFHSFL
ncbi:unnamed protein product [Nezara viridula]|uniref:Uncharacterized protein n=1 Tax=Nezara viridula TaxID=85310 RepID=A0A9P0HSN4_NEZVI|nr:unnamed protein product [Nezara viridula]